ncbi:LytR/AlgR family response regulator transcription factor [Mesonia sediminis]|uniref:LytR/AlgR family response regulator transcription factor n=1 Tax=Mesonia sediminis TaxID=1703946 RepID=A0ABW5SFN8_9FLAO
MTKILIIEDEIPARNKLKRFIKELDTSNEIIAELDTVQSAVEFLKQYQPDLIFSDIELLDGNAFEIYSQIPVSCPIIFTTAYDQFWMNAFEENGIDYLLKPFPKVRFQRAWNKFLWYKDTSSDASHQFQMLTKIIQQNFQNKAYKKRFTVHKNTSIYFLETEDIVLFEADEGVIFTYDKKGNKHLLSKLTLTEIEKQLDPIDFFRINRSELIQKNYIEKIERYNKNSLAIKLKGYNNYVKTSQNQTALFREWMEK